MTGSGCFSTIGFGVFVPAVLGAGVVFSIVTLLYDMVRQARWVARHRQAGVRGTVAAGAVVGVPPGGTRAAATDRSPRQLVAVGLGAIAFGFYVAVGSTGNYLRSDGYLSDIAWLWGASLLVGVLANLLGAAALVMAAMSEPPGWIWPILAPTPLMAAEARPPAEERARWLAIGSAILLAVVAIAAADRPRLPRIDRWVTDRVESTWIGSNDILGTWVGATSATLAVVVVAAVLIRRCRRLARVMAMAAGVALVLTASLHLVVNRPRPVGGPFTGGGSFPSGHLVQATLLTVLVPLGVWEVTRRVWARRLVTVVMAGFTLYLAAYRVVERYHHPTDVIGGILLGLMLGAWARGSLMDVGTHESCGRCVFRSVDGGDAP